MKPTAAYFAAALALGGAVVAVPARAEVVATSEIGFVSRNVADVTATPYEAWTALVSPAKWWNKSHSWSGDAAGFYMDAQAGGCFCELLPVPDGAPEGTRRGSVEHMRVIFADPGRVMRLSGALGPLQGDAVVGTLTVTFKPVEGGTRITWEYAVGGFMRMRTDQIGPGADAMLADQLSRLAVFLGPLVREAPAAPEGEAALAPEGEAALAPEGEAPGDAPAGEEAGGNDVSTQSDGGDQPAIEEPAAEPTPPADTTSAAPAAEASAAAPQIEARPVAVEPAPARPRRLRRPLTDGPADPESSR